MIRTAPLKKANQQQQIVPMGSRWAIIYKGTGDTADGLVESPYLLADFDGPAADGTGAMWQPAGLSNGAGTERLLLNVTLNCGQLQLLPLFSVDGATALVQLWGFELEERQQFAKDSTDNEDPEPRIIKDASPGESGIWVLGEAYNMCRDDAGNPRSFGAAATDDVVTLKADLVHGDPLIRDQNGDSWVVGARHKFDTDGTAAFMVNVPVLSAGSIIIAARFI